MNLRPYPCFATLLLLSAGPAPARAQPSEPKKVESVAVPEPREFVTEHSARFNGTLVTFRARAGETFVRDEEGKPVASFFNVAYTKKDASAADPATRPVSFIYNGGPGSASLWLHMGVFGPRRVVVPNDPSDDGAPPYDVVDNPSTLLDVSDLVFIDPVGTGYSRALGGTDPKKFWGVMEDARSVADFIQTWVTENGRWNSPKYIIGESYGTARSAVVSDELSRRDISVNGIVLISTVLDYQNSRFQDGAIMGYVSFLPTYAATAWYHQKLPNRPPDLAAFLDEVREFSRNEYALALIAGNRLSVEERGRVLDKLSRYTGLDREYLDQANLRVPVSRFFKQLLRDEKKVIGRLDGRYLGIEPDVVAETYESDPTSDSTGSAFTAAINSHLASFLDVKMDRPYVTSSRDAATNWNWLVSERAPNGGRFINLVPSLGRAMRHNEDLRVLVACGYYDFATPFFGAENALSEEGIVPERIRFTYYRAGHMMYLDSESREELLKNVHAFITGSEP
jgi:carboxypeptidase C (cathepsin A)